jgi:hypothetical protein
MITRMHSAVTTLYFFNMSQKDSLLTSLEAFFHNLRIGLVATCVLLIL